MSASAGLIQKLPWDLVGSITAQYIERAPKPAETVFRRAARRDEYIRQRQPKPRD
jgi:iron complex outermembrane receptor protein